MISANAIALERLLVRRKTLSGVLLNADAYDRWGSKGGPEYDRIMAEAAGAGRDQMLVTEELTKLARETWASDRDSVIAWANAHIDLLQRFIAARTGKENETESTAVFVARGELDEWRHVVAGERGFVDENCYYIHLDPNDHAEYFGTL